MEFQSRIRNSIRNTTFSITGQIISIIFQFILRSVFINYLGVQFLGINGLFTNILTVLSLTELGLGTSLVVGMYKPLAVNDIRSIQAHINAYKKIYVVIGVLVAVIGVFLIPFLPYLIKDSQTLDLLVPIYLLYLTDSVCTYFFAHNRALLSAKQQDYVNTINKSFFTVLQIIVQIICLVIYRNFILYLAIRIGFNILSNFQISMITRKMFPYLKEKNDNVLTKEERNALFKNATGIFSQRFGFTVLNSTDNIVISTFIGSLAVGFYSNYSMIIGTISTLIGLVVAAVQASIGNLCSISSRDKIREVFLNINFAYFWIYGFCTICLGVLTTPFINIWLGNKYEISQYIVCVCVLNFYFANSRQALISFEIALGLLWKIKYKPIIEVLINIIMSVILVQKIGIVGVFLGTTICSIATSLWIEPLVLYKYYFKESAIIYYRKYIFYFIVTVIGFGSCFFLCDLVKIGNVVGFLIKCLICLTLPNLLYYFVFRKTKEYIYLKSIVNALIKKKYKSEMIQ